MKQRILAAFFKYFRSHPSDICLLYLYNVWISVVHMYTFGFFLHTLKDERSVKPYKCLSAFLFSLADKIKYPCLYNTDYIPTDTHINFGYLF